MKKTYLPKPHGFTIVELLVVIVIVGLLSVLGIMSGRKNLKAAVLSEGEAFIEEIVTKERLYRANSGEFLNINKQYNSDTLQINGRKNKYFNKFSVFSDPHDSDYQGAKGFCVAIYGTSNEDEHDLVTTGISMTGKYNSYSNTLKIRDNIRNYEYSI